MEWKHSRSPRSKKFCYQKFLASMYWYSGGLIVIDYLDKEKTIKGDPN